MVCSIYLSRTLGKCKFQEGVLTLTNLEFTFKFIRHFIIRECAFCGDEVENLFVVRVVSDVSSNQLAVPYYTPHVWTTLKEKIPLVFNFTVHLFLLKCSPNPFLVKDINHGFEKEVEETLLSLS
jgi:hypothetical protein